MLGLVSLTVTSCFLLKKSGNNSESQVDPDALQLVQYDPYTGITNHRNMRINGEGYASEQYMVRWTA